MDIFWIADAVWEKLFVDGRWKREEGKGTGMQAGVYLFVGQGCARNATGKVAMNGWGGRCLCLAWLQGGREACFAAGTTPGTHRRALLDWQTDKHLFQETPPSFPSSFH